MFASFFASIKALSQDISEYQMVAVTYSLSAMTLFGTNLTRGISPFQPRTKVPIMIFRGLVGGLGLICVTYSTYILPLSDAAFLSNSYPGNFQTQQKTEDLSFSSRDSSLGLVDRNGATELTDMDWSPWLHIR